MSGSFARVRVPNWVMRKARGQLGTRVHVCFVTIAAAAVAGSDGDSSDHTDGNTQGPAVIPDISQTLKADMCNNSDRVK